jgi:hypothetical protein
MIIPTVRETSPGILKLQAFRFLVPRCFDARVRKNPFDESQPSGGGSFFMAEWFVDEI